MCDTLDKKTLHLICQRLDVWMGETLFFYFMCCQSYLFKHILKHFVKVDFAMWESLTRNKEQVTFWAKWVFGIIVQHFQLKSDTKIKFILLSLFEKWPFVYNTLSDFSGSVILKKNLGDRKRIGYQNICKKTKITKFTDMSFFTPMPTSLAHIWK